MDNWFEYLDRIDAERERRPSEAMLADWIRELHKSAAYWMSRAEAAEESLRLAMDEGLRAW